MDDIFFTKQVLKEVKRMRLDDKYLWCITQNFNEYSDILTNIKTIENENIGSLCHIFQKKGDKQTVYIRFEGTQLSIKDILVDMFFFKAVTIIGKVHAGVYSAVLSIFRDIREYLQYKQLLDKNIVVFGHSLGAMMAKEFVRKIVSYIGNGNIKIITFGTARTGDKNYASYFDKFDMKEYVISSDPITWLPLRIMGYKHTNKLVKIKKWVWDAHHSYGRYL